MLTRLRAGQSQVLVLRGEAGVGKTALLEYVMHSASGCRLARAGGVQSEMELAFSGMHQLCAPMLDRLERLPGPQRDVLGTVFGLSDGQPPGRFVVSLALLGLLSEVAEQRPLVCLVDDAQWLDRASAQALAFAARRLAAESIALVFAVRDPGEVEFDGLPSLQIKGLDEADSKYLLRSVVKGPLDEQVLDRVVAETRGNPLALMEMPRGLNAAQLAGGFGLPPAQALTGQIEESFMRRLAVLPPETRRLLLLAATDPVGHSLLLWRAAELLGISADAGGPAVEAGLIGFGPTVRFRHPLVRSAVYRSASPQARQQAHRALAEVTDPDVDPDRRAWHLAQAAAGPDEYVAEQLERSAGRAQSRGGLAAAAAFLERSASLTLDPALRINRLIAAAQAKHQAGALEAARGLLASAQVGPLDALGRARLDLLRARIAADSRELRDAPTLLLRAAKRLEPLDDGLARETYRDAFYAALRAGRLANADGTRQVADALRRAPPSPEPGAAPALLLDGLAVLLTDGHAAGAPILKLAIGEFLGEEASIDDGFRGWLPLACRMSHDVWEDESWRVLSQRLLELARAAGDLAILPTALMLSLGFHVFSGELGLAASMAEEAEAVTRATGNPTGPYGASVLAAWRGQEAELHRLHAVATADMVSQGEGQWLTHVAWADAVLYNSLGRYHEALAAAEQGSQHQDELGLSTWSTVELIEAASRSGTPERAAAAFARLCETTTASGSDWALGIEARARALLSDGPAAEGWYRESIDRLGRTRIRIELARSSLVYGEWLRRHNRRVDAREQLRNAFSSFTTMGAAAFAERARRELLATGETVRKRSVDTRDELTPQEAQIARLAREGLTNPEIGAQLFISPRTVEWHLRKVFTKLGIGSRRELSAATSEAAWASDPA